MAQRIQQAFFFACIHNDNDDQKKRWKKKNADTLRRNLPRLIPSRSSSRYRAITNDNHAGSSSSITGSRTPFTALLRTSLQLPGSTESMACRLCGVVSGGYIKSSYFFGGCPGEGQFKSPKVISSHLSILGPQPNHFPRQEDIC